MTDWEVRNKLLGSNGGALLLLLLFSVLHYFGPNSPPFANAFYTACKTVPPRISARPRHQFILSPLFVSKEISDPSLPKSKLRTWDESFNMLVEYKKKFGNCNVPQNYRDDPKLGNWVMTQRKQYKNSNLSKDKVEKLNEIGFQWKLLRTFDDNYQLLIQYKDQFGDCNVPKGFENDPVLGSFVHEARACYKKGSLAEWKVDKLNALGFVWEKRENDWWNLYQQLATYHKIHGHCDIPTTDRAPLQSWVAEQRKKRKFLSESQTQALDDLGFTWTGVLEKKRNNQWIKTFEELKEYKRIYGHTQVPYRSGSLGEWVSHQRSEYHNGRLSEDRREMLESVGFIWRLKEASLGTTEAQNRQWFDMYEKLKEFKKQHNHTRVPRTYEVDKQLRNWVGNQKAMFKRGELRPERVQLLDTINFSWSFDNLFEQRWHDKYLAVAMFYQENRHWPSKGSLYDWMMYQRWRKANGNMEPERIAKLDEIDFPWRNHG